MSYLELDGDRHKIPAGEAVIGSDASSFLVVDGADLAPQHAVLVGTADGQVSVRRVTEEAAVFINGVQLGPQPAPLLHGDKIEVGGRELTFVDERRSGSTQFVSAEDIAKLRQAAGKPAKKGKTTSGTGGRLVSLTDGREYTIEGSSIVFGREAICDIVVPQKRVSRRHAEIIVTAKGYLVTDLSSNGTFVNGERIAGQRLLARADVVRVGDHEFRFYADAAPDPEPVATKPTPAAPAGAKHRLSDTMHGLPTPTAPAGAEFRLGDTLHGLPSSALSPAPPGQAPPSQAAPPPVPAPSTPSVAPPGQAPPSPSVAPPRQAPPTPSVAPPGQAPPSPSVGPPGQAPPTQPVAPPRQAPPSQPVAPPQPAPPPRASAPAAPPPSPAKSAAAAPVPSSSGGILANLIVRKGQLKGHRFPIRVPIVNVGRAEYNDVVVPDQSVSSAHAKIQLREGIWVLVDLDSTNGTFVDGDPVSGEAPIAPGAVIRFGEVSVVFESTKDDTAQQGGGTQVLGVIVPPEEHA